MKLIILIKNNPFAVSGASSNRLLGLLKQLLNHGYQITLLISGGYYEYGEKDKFNSEGVHCGMNYFYLSRYDNTTLFKRRLYHYFFRFFLYFIIKFRFSKFLDPINSNCVIWIKNDIVNYRLIHNYEKRTGFVYFMEINEFPDIHLHNNSTRFFWQKSISNITNSYFNSKILPTLDGLALMTYALENYFLGKICKETKILHLPMTVDLERFDLGIKYELFDSVKGPYIAFIGSMNDSKDGVNILIESFINIAPKFPDLNLCLFGYWAYDTNRHLKKIKDSKLEARILYSRPINSKDVINVLMNASLLVLPRPNSYQAQGGFPTKLGEYLGSSKPVIATTVGEIPLYLKNRHSIFFCEPGSVSSLSETIISVLLNPELSEKVAKEGRRIAENVFSTSVQAKRLAVFLKGLF